MSDAKVSWPITDFKTETSIIDAMNDLNTRLSAIADRPASDLPATDANNVLSADDRAALNEAKQFWGIGSTVAVALDARAQPAPGAQIDPVTGQPVQQYAPNANQAFDPGPGLGRMTDEANTHEWSHEQFSAMVAAVEPAAADATFDNSIAPDPRKLRADLDRVMRWLSANFAESWNDHGG